MNNATSSSLPASRRLIPVQNNTHSFSLLGAFKAKATRLQNNTKLWEQIAVQLLHVVSVVMTLLFTFAFLRPNESYPVDLYLHLQCALKKPRYLEHKATINLPPACKS